jgi:hypothetical protein
MSSRCTSLLPRTTLHSDSEQYSPFSVYGNTENGTNGNGKWKRQSFVCLLQMETENESLFSLVG